MLCGLRKTYWKRAAAVFAHFQSAHWLCFDFSNEILINLMVCRSAALTGKRAKLSDADVPIIQSG